MSRDALMKEVLASPDDDTPRMVLADVLSQAGEPQGELIVVQCELANMAPGDPKRAELVRRERALLKTPELAAQEEKIRAKYPVVPVWKRGFISEVKISADWLKKVGSKLFAELPLLDGLDLGGCAKCYGKLIPELARVKTLTIGMGTSEHVAHLDLPAFANLRELTIRGTPIGKAMDDLCAWKTIKPRILRLPKTSIRDPGARTLAKAKLDLDLLDLRENHVSEAAAAELRAAYGDHLALTDEDLGKAPKKPRAPSTKPKREKYWDKLGLPACVAWASARGLNVASKPKWFAEVYLDVKDEPAGQGYWGNKDSRFHVKVQSPEWNVLFCHAGKTSSIRVREEAFDHGGDPWNLKKGLPELEAIGTLLRSLEKKHDLQFKREHAYVRTNITGAKPILRKWALSL